MGWQNVTDPTYWNVVIGASGHRLNWTGSAWVMSPTTGLDSDYDIRLEATSALATLSDTADAFRMTVQVGERDSTYYGPNRLAYGYDTSPDTLIGPDVSGDIKLLTVNSYHPFAVGDRILAIYQGGFSAAGPYNILKLELFVPGIGSFWQDFVGTQET